MATTFDVALVGATGAVGEAMIEILEQRDFPVGIKLSKELIHFCDEEFKNILIL